MSIFSKYESQKAVVRLAREVSNESIFALCDEIDLAVDYYKYPEIEIQLDSPGGSIDSLEYYLERLAAWKEQDITISTLAMTEVSSAAAIILTLGDIGKRRAYASSRLLFHSGRIMTQRPMTACDLDLQRSMLKELDRRINEKVATHLLDHRAFKEKTLTYPERDIVSMDGAEPLVESQTYKQGMTLPLLAEKLAQLNLRDTPIRPEDALALYLIDKVEA